MMESYCYRLILRGEGTIVVFLFVFLWCWAVAAADIGVDTTGGVCKTTDDSKPVPSKVYVYQDEIFHHGVELDRCDPGGISGSTADFKHAVGGVLLEYLRTGRSRQVIETQDPGEADWFYVPFNVDRSAAQHVIQCGQTHDMRLNAVVDALEASPHYRRFRGADHFWYLGGWELTTAGIGKLPYFKSRREILHNMSVLRYSDRRVHLRNTQPKDDEDEFRWESSEERGGTLSPKFNVIPDARHFPAWWRQGQDHRCTVNVPHRSNQAITKYHKKIAQNQTTLEEWEKARPYKFHFVGLGDDYRYITGIKETVKQLVDRWYQTAALLPPDKVFHVKEPLPPEAFAESLSRSQFCITIRSDDPSRTRFYDALSAGCIPIVISDGFRGFAAGYGRMLHNYDSFTITIPESNWIVNAASALMYAVTMPRNELRFMHSSLMEIRPKLVYHVDDQGDGENSSQAAENIFRILNERCKLGEHELREYSS